jgi:hypothetical protein
VYGSTLQLPRLTAPVSIAPIERSGRSVAMPRRLEGSWGFVLSRRVMHEISSCAGWILVSMSAVQKRSETKSASHFATSMRSAVAARNRAQSLPVRAGGRLPSGAVHARGTLVEMKPCPRQLGMRIHWAWLPAAVFVSAVSWHRRGWWTLLLATSGVLGAWSTGGHGCVVTPRASIVWPRGPRRHHRLLRTGPALPDA